MIEIVAGSPVHVEGRELVPVVSVEIAAQRRAFVGSRKVAGEGMGFVRLRPVAVLERSELGERRIPVRDRTAQWLGGLLLAAFIIPLLMMVAERVVRRP